MYINYVSETGQDEQRRQKKQRQGCFHSVETAEQREESLAKRLSTESLEEREARLLQLSTNQRERLADETVKQKEARLQRASDRNIRASGEEPSSVQLKIKNSFRKSVGLV